MSSRSPRYALGVGAATRISYRGYYVPGRVAKEIKKGESVTAWVDDDFGAAISRIGTPLSFSE